MKDGLQQGGQLGSYCKFGESTKLSHGNSKGNENTDTIPDTREAETRVRHTHMRKDNKFSFRNVIRRLWNRYPNRQLKTLF